MQGEEVTVVYVLPQDAKRTKTWLTQQGALHTDFRMHPTRDGRKIAIPVVPSFECELYERGTCFCPYSSSILGNPQIKQNAIQTVLKNFLQSQVPSCPDLNITMVSSTIRCPSHFELMGDDRTVVIPSRALDPADLSAWIQARNPEWTPAFDRLWQSLAQLYSSRRVVRRGHIDPNSKIRHSTFQVLWHDGSFQPAAGWITITEQGIRQSFDLTKVMFSRGNITEKIRFGQQSANNNNNNNEETVLDLYAGIGYFTLPALVHGKAQHVVACEWNPEAIRALRYNLQDNGVSDRATVIEGDCRVADWGSRTFDRVSLGLLPSSQGGWKTAVHALKRPDGGWLHIHGNVPVTEVDVWGKWLCVQLQQYAAAEWIVVLKHIQKVKSFAPTVNHYVADVCLGPPERVAQRTQCEELLRQVPPQAILLHRGSVEVCVEPVLVPSCALSETGVLHQAWMREL